MAQRDRRRKPLAACAVVGSKRHQYRKRLDEHSVTDGQTVRCGEFVVTLKAHEAKEITFKQGARVELLVKRLDGA